MSEQQSAGSPLDPGAAPEAHAAVGAQLGEQAGQAFGQDVAGIYGDVAGASQHGPGQSEADLGSELAAKGAAPAQADISGLLDMIRKQAEQLDALQQRIDTAQAAAPSEVRAVPPSLAEVIANSALGAPAAHAFSVIEERLSRLEKSL